MFKIHVQNIYVFKFSHETIKNHFKMSFVVFSITDFHICVHTVPLFLSSSFAYSNWFPDRQGPDKSWTVIMEKSQGANTLTLSSFCSWCLSETLISGVSWPIVEHESHSRTEYRNTKANPLRTLLLSYLSLALDLNEWKRETN